MHRDDTDEMNVFLYFLILFRDIPAVRNVLNDPDTPIVLIERLLLFASIFFYSEDLSCGVFKNIIDILEPDRSLEIVLGSISLQRDLRLVFSVLMTYDTAQIDSFFARTQTIREIATGFIALPENMTRDLLIHNVILFDYLRSILPVYVEKGELERFNSMFAHEIELTRTVNKYVELYRQLEHELAGDTGAHVALILQVLDHLGKDAAHLFFERCASRGIIIPEMEMLLVRALIDSPVMAHLVAALKRKVIPGIERLNALDSEAQIQLF